MAEMRQINCIALVSICISLLDNKCYFFAHLHTHKPCVTCMLRYLVYACTELLTFCIVSVVILDCKVSLAIHMFYNIYCFTIPMFCIFSNILSVEAFNY